jgi:DNA-binding response OmpR family regulator
VHIIVVEGEKKVASFVQRGLEAKHDAVDVAGDGEAGLLRAIDRAGTFRGVGPDP